jgi:photosystem II stability/assembly factor-like uncharacterized protein
MTWLASASFRYVAGANGTLLHTADEGDTWQLSGLDQSQLYGIDLRNVHLTAGAALAPGSGGKMLFTATPGNRSSWRLVTSCSTSDGMDSWLAEGQVAWTVHKNGAVCTTDDVAAPDPIWTAQVPHPTAPSVIV